MLATDQFALGAVLALAAGLLGWLGRALATSGMAAAVVIGMLIFGLGGLPWAALMLVFFFTSSLLSRTFSAHKRSISVSAAKGSRRDWAQVLANGGVGAFLALVSVLFPEAIWPWLAYAGSMAAVNADTWATELGVLSPRQPRLITTGQPVPMGASGGVTVVGTAATMAGGLLIAVIGVLVRPDVPAAGFVLAVTAAGVAGSLIDSLLGATVQAIYFDQARDKETEKQVFSDDGQTVPPLRGWAWMNNDAVNFIGSVCGALAAVVFWQLFT